MEQAPNNRIQKIAKLLNAPEGSDYDRLSKDFGELTNLVREEISARILPVMKEKIRGMPHTEYADKQALAKWVNGELRRYGLALRCRVKVKGDGIEEERTYPAILVANVGNQPRLGRFQLHCTTEEGRVVRPLSTPELPVLLDHFELMVDDPDRRRWGKWTEHAGRKHQDRAR